MGKPYAGELVKLGDTYNSATESDITPLEEFVRGAASTPLHVVGSGGSLTACVFASTLHDWCGHISRVSTPLEFLNGVSAHGEAILLISANGKNKDILAAFDRAMSMEPECICILCTRKEENILVKKAANVHGVHVCCVDIPSGRDGFLATNSLVATCVWLARAYRNVLTGINGSPVDGLLPNLGGVFGLGGARGGNDAGPDIPPLLKSMQKLRGLDTLMVIHDADGRPAAVDIESKCSEAGLVNVQVADYRSFAHGRHNWIGKNPKTTGVIALRGDDESTLPEDTLALIPDTIPRVVISTWLSGMTGMLSLLVQSMYAVGELGKFKGIDPGCPGVADFGANLYKLGMDARTMDMDMSHHDVIIGRKLGQVMPGSARYSLEESLKGFAYELSETMIDGVVFGYDGSLCDGVPRDGGAPAPSPETIRMLVRLLERDVRVGITCAGGQDVREVLQMYIPLNMCRGVVMGYHSSTEIGTLDSMHVPESGLPPAPELAKVAEYLEGVALPKDAVEIHAGQITVRVNHPREARHIMGRFLTSPDVPRDVHLSWDGHATVMIRPQEASNTALIGRIAQDAGGDRILCIGDQGEWPGNDFELLSTPYSLSTTRVSSDRNTCWNVAPAGCTGEAAARYYIGMADIKQDGKLGLERLAGAIPRQ